MFFLFALFAMAVVLKGCGGGGNGWGWCKGYSFKMQGQSKKKCGIVITF